MHEFLRAGAGFKANFNLVSQVAMGVALIGGALLARAKRYTAHGICQAAVLLLNLIMIAFIMWPSFYGQVLPALPKHVTDRYYGAATAHGILGAVAELLGLYIVLAVGTNILPRRVRISRWKLWMRIELVLWWVLIVTGVLTYYVWYAEAP
ncbi:MAG: hypothetical protein WBQ86_15275 [Candidatus Binatus sp.]